MISLVYELPAGTLIGGRYKLLKALGQGGFGITYIAWDNELQRNVAVKECFPVGLCLRDQVSGSVRPVRAEWESLYLRALEDMRSETHTLASLNHDNIVRVHDIIWGNGSVFCVMPWLDSGTLKDRMESDMPSAQESQQWLRLLLDALGYLHSRGIYHRDLKPDNIMFNESGEPVIIDFGAALNRPELTSSTTSQGAYTRGYAAPEQITGKGKIGPWTDFYSLSATWYELLTGKRPEASDARLMQDDLEPLSSASCRLSYPTDLLALLERNMRLRPVERCCSVAQWLDCWEHGVLPPVPLPKGGGVRRRRVFLSLALFMVALVVAVIAVFPTAQRQPAAAPTAAPTAAPAGSPLNADQIEEIKTNLTAKVRRELKLDEHDALCAESVRQYNEVGETYLARIRDLIARYEQAMAQVKSSSEMDRLSTDFFSEHYKLLNDRTDAINDVQVRAYKQLSSYRKTPDEISANYRPESIEEAAIFPSVALEQAQACMDSFAPVMISEFACQKEIDAEEKRYDELLSEMNARRVQFDDEERRKIEEEHRKIEEARKSQQW